MTVAPTKRPSVFSRVLAVYKWASQPTTRKDIGAVVAAVTALYVAGHRAGIF